VSTTRAYAGEKHRTLFNLAGLTFARPNKEMGSNLAIFADG